MRRLTEVTVSQILDIAHVHRTDTVHLAEVTDDGRNVVGRVGTQRTGAQANGVCRAVVELDDLFVILLAVGNAGQTEDGPGMAETVMMNYIPDDA